MSCMFYALHTRHNDDYNNGNEDHDGNQECGVLFLLEDISKNVIKKGTNCAMNMKQRTISITDPPQWTTQTLFQLYHLFL